MALDLGRPLILCRCQLAVRIARWLSADRASRRWDGAILQVTALKPGMCTLFGVAFAGRKSGLARGRLALGSGLVPLKVLGASQVIACILSQGDLCSRVALFCPVG